MKDPWACRKNLRLSGFNYSSPGQYFVTVNVNSGKHFGEVTGGEMRRSRFGDVAAARWEDIPKYYASVRVDKYIVMPDHIHEIIIIDPDDDRTADTRAGADIIRPVSRRRSQVTRHTSHDWNYGPSCVLCRVSCDPNGIYLASGESEKTVIRYVSLKLTVWAFKGVEFDAFHC